MHEHTPLKLDSIENYKKSTLQALKEQIEKHYADISLLSIDELKDKVDYVNAYPNLKHLRELSEDGVFVLDEENIDIREAEQTVLDGKFFFEHACAGEATRLGLGTKYLLNMKDIPLKQITEGVLREKTDDIKKDDRLTEQEKEDKINEAKKEITEENIKEQCGGDTGDLRDMSLGTRHMLQLAFDIKKLAEKYNQDFYEIIKKQTILIIVNESTGEKIISDFIKYNFFGFSRENVYFMIQQSFPGVYIKGNELVYHEDKDTRRLHNHGQMYMQKTHENSIFSIKDDGEKKYLSSAEFESILESHKDFLSYNIEDISYLTGSIDYPSLAKALELGQEGYEMVMEIVAQNPIRPQKGGAAFYDAKLGRNVLVEINRMLNLRLDEIKHLNRNFNHYPAPAKSFKTVKEKGLMMCFSVKTSKKGDSYIYPCPFQGDINYLVKTAFLVRKNMKPIHSWKSFATAPSAAKGMFDQDSQDGFIDFAEKILGEKI